MIPWGELEAVFLDAGNTLVSIDFDRVAAELATQGFACDAHALRRAEAAARPALSRFVADRSTEGADSFRFYVRELVGRLGPVAASGAPALERVAAELALRLREPGASHRLWRWVLPGVPEALASLRDQGLQLLVVSNSDGTVERGLDLVGLRGYFSAVVDSALVGFEKPDPRIFEHALERAGVSGRQALHVGDLYHADVTGARAAGVNALLLDPFGDWDGVDCERARDLLELAQRMRAARARAPRGRAAPPRPRDMLPPAPGADRGRREPMTRRFSLAARIASFGHAFRGIAELLATQHNAWIHAAATLAVCALGALLGISAGEWLAVVLAIAVVWSAEAMNTAFEALCDVVSPERQPRIRRAKDVAAGAVLLCAMGAATVGLIVFGPRVVSLLR